MTFYKVSNFKFRIIRFLIEIFETMSDTMGHNYMTITVFTLTVLYYIILGWEKRYEGFVRPQVLKQLNDDGKLGRKTGEGFFKYKK